MNLYEKALKVAVRAHREQVRKHDNTPYVYHPIMVARLVEQAGFPEVAVAAALVHDVLEDTPVSEEQLRAELGDSVVSIVAAVSEDKALVWEERKEKYVSEVVAAGELVWAVSVADKIHNAKDFIAFYPVAGKDAWKIFNRDKTGKIWFEKLLHRELSKVWQHPLLDTYAAKIAELETLSD